MPRQRLSAKDLAQVDRSSVFNAEYYMTGCGPFPYERNERWLPFFAGIAAEIVRSLHPESVFDMGCAMGMLAESLWDLGVPAKGIDISSYAIEQVRPDMRRYCSVGSVTAPIDQRYDLVTCIEVLEHVLPEEAQQAIAVMAAATDTILFSSTPNDFVEETHVNVQPVAAWVEQFGSVGFVPDLVFDASFLAPHAILFRKARERLSADVAALFSKYILIRTALVEREQRIGRLSADLAELHAERDQISDELRSFAANWDQMDVASRAEGDAKGSRCREVAAATDEVSRLAQINQDMRCYIDQIELRLKSAGANDAEHEGLVLHLQQATSRVEQLEKEISDKELSANRILEANHDLRLRLVELTDDLTAAALRADAEVTRVTQQLKDSGSYIDQLEKQILQQELSTSRIKAELQEVYSSPGWRLVSTYRKWLNRHRMKGGIVARRLEPLLEWSVRAAGLAPKASGRAPNSHVALVPVPTAAPELTEGPSNSSVQEASKAISMAAPVIQTDLAYDAWITRTEPSGEDLKLQRAISRHFRLQPLISIVVPVFKVPLPVLRATLDSVRQQTYPNWQLCILHADRDDAAARQYLSEAASQDSRIRVELASENLGISVNSNAALKTAAGEYLALLDHDDTLAPFALYEVVKVINEKPAVDFIYSDKDCLSEDGSVRLKPLFKPAWSPDIMLSANYLTHFNVMRTEVVRALGGWRSETDGAQDWDIFLRVTERSQSVEFIPKVLYHWRIIATSVASAGFKSKPYAANAQLLTVDHHLKQLGVRGTPARSSLEILKVEWNGLQELGASIIVVSNAPAGSIQRRARSLAAQTNHPAFEVIAIGPGLKTGAEGSIRWINCPEQMTLPSRLSEAVRNSQYPCIVFVDDSVEIAERNWVGELVGPLQQEKIGLVGAKLLDSVTSRLRHVGIVFNRDGRPDNIFSGEPEHVNNTFGDGYWYRNWSAVSGACFAVRRSVWDQLRGFHENPAYPRLDIDLCLRLRFQLGLRILYNPFARFQQSEGGLLENWLSPAGPDSAAGYIRACFSGGDPYFHSQLESRNGRVVFARGEAATPSQSDYGADARALTAGFDFCKSDVERSIAACSTPARREIKSLTWFLPEFSHGFYGGIHTILRFAEYFRRKHQVSSHFVFLGNTPESVMRSRIANVFPQLGQECGVSRLSGYAQLDSIPESDATIATLWTTAFAALRFTKTRRKFYFIQDYESMFYPAGSINALVEATYRFGFHGICNTRGLLDTYVSLGGQAESFDPCIDPSIFFPPLLPKASKPAMVFCYARPGHPRNCFELLASALTRVKRALGDDIRIVAAGAEWEPSTYGLDGVVQNLGLIGYSATGALYRACDAGVVMMMTRHPSYLPMELMACGALVVTNYNPHTTWLLRDRENCLLTETSASAVADTVLEGLSDDALRSRISNAAQETVRHYEDWDSEADKIYRYMLNLS
jgi:GT2 family glycosyltransferase/glycosyltransferase involved in cell wall biosynthesis/predicted  nucleic acid-binding Zn-ribbon protein